MSDGLDLQLGPFYDRDGMVILRVLTEATEAAVERVMEHCFIFSNLPSGRLFDEAFLAGIGSTHSESAASASQPARRASP